MRNKKLFIKGDSAYIGLTISLLGLIIAGVVLILVGIDKEELLQIGVVLVVMDLVICLILLIASAFIPLMAVLNHEGITQLFLIKNSNQRIGVSLKISR